MVWAASPDRAGTNPDVYNLATLMSRRSTCGYWWLALIAWATAGAEESTRPEVLEVVGGRPFLRYERQPYRNFAFDNFTQYPDHTWGARAVGGQIGVSMGLDRQQDLYDPMGNYLAQGFDLYTWLERRAAGTALRQ